MPTFNDLHRRWLGWLKGDPVQSITRQIYGMMWDDATFRALNEARSYTTGAEWASQNGMLARFIDSSYVAGQSLALSKLVDRRTDVISLGRLVGELRQYRKLITRREYLAIAQLPYDYEPIARAAMDKIMKSGGASFSREPTTGPQAWAVSRMQHELFDRLSGSNASNRAPDDCVSEAVVGRLEAWLNDPEIHKVVQVRHKFIAHAADQKSRGTSLPAGLTLIGIEAAHRIVFRTAAVISGTILYDDAYTTPLPIPQYDQFAYWDKALVPADSMGSLHEHWQHHEEARSNWTEKLLDELLPDAK